MNGSRATQLNMIQQLNNVLFVLAVKACINKDRGVCCFVKMECVHLSMCIECISDKTDAIGVCLKGSGKLCLGRES